MNPFDDEARAILQQMLNNGGDINAYHSDPHRPVDSYVGAVEDRGIEHVIEEVLTMTRAGTALHLVGGNDGMKA